MGRPEVPAALSEIKSPTSIQDRIAALKRLKNDIIGHPLIKELVIKHGIAAPLVRNLQSSLKASGKRRSREVNGHGVALDKDHGWTHEDEMRLQTITIITSLAHGKFYSSLIRLVLLLMSLETPRRTSTRRAFDCARRSTSSPIRTRSQYTSSSLDR